MQTGMSTACFYNRVYNEEALKIISEMGVPRAEIFFSGLTEYRPGFVRMLREIIDDSAIEMISVHAQPTQFEPQLFATHQRQYEEALSIYEDVLKAAHTLGAHIYVFHGPIHLKVARTMNLNMDFIAERVTTIAEMAKDYGVKLCYENVHWCWYKYPGFAQELAARVQSDNLGFTLDLKQAAQSGQDFSEYINDMGQKLSHVHICDYQMIEGKGFVPCLPFQGQTDWRRLREILQTIGYTGTLMLEVYATDYDTYEHLRQSYDEVTLFFKSSER